MLFDIFHFSYSLIYLIGISLTQAKVTLNCNYSNNNNKRVLLSISRIQRRYDQLIVYEVFFRRVIIIKFFYLK
jgi:hypothetical protein